MAQERIKLAVWNGAFDIYVNCFGNGPPLVYLHQAVGFHRDEFLDALAEQFTIYAPEYPGTSPEAPDAVRAVDRLSDMVLIYEEVIRTLGLENPILIGQSFGGMLAAEVAAAFPSLPSRLILLDAVGLWDVTDPIADWVSAPLETLPELLFKDPEGAAVQKFIALPDDPAARADILASNIWSVGCTARFLWPIPEAGLATRLHRIAAPTLILWGRHDRLAPVSYAHRFAGAITNARVIIVEGAGHVPQAEALIPTCEATFDFLEGAA